ncbi:MAG: alpha/beta hydrolase [Stenomitos rutilans HA7619-LM2]|jgi:lysophospholipase L1-like esterase|nr:alpha/beta hydrolase [Stenomitos rutilans HA7619-LM2]
MKRYRYGVLLSSAVLIAVFLLAAPSIAAEKIAVRYGLFEQSLPVADLQQYAETNTVSSSLGFFLRFTSREQQQELRSLLQVKLPIDLVALDRVLNGPIGVNLLKQLATAIVGGDRAGVQALRAAAVLGIKAQGLSILSFLEAYPDQQLKLDLPSTLNVIDASSAKPPTDTLPATPLWQTLVAYQATVSANKPYSMCLFGDSISAQLVNSLEPETVNFALGGMSSVSLVEQLKQFVAKKVICQNVLIAIGTNDAWYTIADDRVSQNLKAAIGLTRQLGATEIALLPAFYSTLAASKKPNLAGPIARVEAINQVIDQVATAEHIPVEASALQPLFAGKTLKDSLTTDGVHLNAAGIEVYRQAILRVINSIL